MRRMLLAGLALTGLTAVTAAGASAAPTMTEIHLAPTHPAVTQVDYYWNHHHYHHRRWEHHHWHYW